MSLSASLSLQSSVALLEILSNLLINSQNWPEYFKSPYNKCWQTRLYSQCFEVQHFIVSAYVAKNWHRSFHAVKLH